MFFLDMPNVPPQNAPIVLAQADASGATPQPDYILNYCKQTQSTGDPRSAMHAVDPAYMLRNYIENRGTQVIELTEIKNVTMLQGATVGKITSVVDNTGRPWYRYDAPPNYVGNDQAVFQAEYQGKAYKIVVKLVVSLTVGESPLMEGEEPVCPAPTLIKVNKKPSAGSSGYGSGYNLAFVSVSYQPNPSFERDAAKARRPSTLRYTSQ